MKATKLLLIVAMGTLTMSAALGQTLSVDELDAGTMFLTNKLNLTDLSSLGQPSGRFVTSDGSGGVQYSSFVASNAGPWRFVPLEDGSLSITNPNSAAYFQISPDGSFVAGPADI